MKIWDVWKWPVDGRNGPGGKIGARMRGGDGLSSTLFAQQLQTGQAGWVQRLGLTQGRFVQLRIHTRWLRQSARRCKDVAILPRDRSDKQNSEKLENAGMRTGARNKEKQGKPKNCQAPPAIRSPRYLFMIFWTSLRERLPVERGRCRSSSSRFWRRRQSSSRSRGQHGGGPGR